MAADRFGTWNNWFGYDPNPFLPIRYSVQSIDVPIPPGNVVNGVLVDIGGVQINDQGVIAGFTRLYSQGPNGRLVGASDFVINSGAVVSQTPATNYASAYNALYKVPLVQTFQSVLGSNPLYQSPFAESASGAYILGTQVNYSPAGVGLGDTNYVEHNGQFTTLTISTIGSQQVDDFVTPTAVNDQGVIVGWGDVLPNDSIMSFIYDHGKSSAISIAGATSTFATGINDAGEIVGYYTDIVAGHVYDHGFIDMNGKIQLFDIAGSTSTTITGINDKGQIVGCYTTAVAPIGNVLNTGFPIYGSSGDHVFVATPQTHASG
jgi:hypothetical protein